MLRILIKSKMFKLFYAFILNKDNNFFYIKKYLTFFFIS